MHPVTEAVVDHAARYDLTIETTAFPEGTRSAEDAAAAIGVVVAQIVKSLVFELDGAPVMALVAGDNRLDETKFAAALGGSSVGRASPDVVRSATGAAIGGVPPFGHPSVLATAIDDDLFRHDVVWAAAGTPRDVFPIAPADLARASGAVRADLRVD